MLTVASLLGVLGGVATGEERIGRRRQMLALTNQDRVRYDRRSLEFAGRLARYAKRHSQEMAEASRLFDDLRGALEGHEWSLGGENIGVGDSLEALEDAFMSSLPHRENILRRLWVTVVFYG
ncbi:MAG: CAP domain-containing protein [Actinobacteria bacterium]|nr:CAP domain-containing protein [Actinomycetota bacterium]